jgi:hypothetical protein
MKTKTPNQGEVSSEIKSRRPEEELAAGGTTASAIRMGKTYENMIKTMEKESKPEPFSEEEWADLMLQLANDK